MTTTTDDGEQRTPTTAQLHGEACIDCGSKVGPFTAAGHTYTRSCEGGRLGWPVVACPEHQGAAACGPR